MPSIEQPNTGVTTGPDKVPLKPVEYFDKSVKQGYDRQNTQSHNDAIAEFKRQEQHRLIQPRVVAGVDSFSTARAALSSADALKVNPEEVANANLETVSPQMKSVQEGAKVMQGIQHLESVVGPIPPEKKAEVFKLINAAPSSMSTEEAWKWAEANLTPQEQEALELMFGKPGSDQFSFMDALIKKNALISGPRELVKEINNEFNKLTQIMSKGEQLWDTDVITTILSSIQQKMQDNRLKFDEETILIAKNERQRLSNKVISDLEKSIKKTEKAKKADRISKIFGYIGIAVMVAVTVLAMMSGVGAPAAILMMAALMLTIGMTLDEDLNDGGMMAKFAELIQEMLGVDEQEANWIAMGIIMAILLALTFGAGGASASTAGASKFAALGSKAGLVAGGATAVGEGGAKAASAAYTYEASMLQADSKENKAKMLRLQQLIEDATESLQNAMEDLQAGHARIAAIISDNDDTKKQIGRNLR